ncbi:glycosyltransferase family 4 protein [Flavobacterium solisilvae]|uniref:Glycosyltransferase family 4 protein n=1 Tax=Flavobacterium solisilvae TaxID=1852019 RepID=A0ABX1QSR7_9FLAO|nr:glycosyltransferase family 4 protein [Flavobacterium solisilvae]NMH25326.1 glycosyltransferase family 4 protein [Flavobacterium solisilvae]
MKILYIYDNYPQTYQKYLLVLLKKLREKQSVSSLTYSKSPETDYNVVSYGFKDKIQRLKYKLGVSKFPSLDSKIMSKFDIVHIQHSYLWRKLLVFEKLPNKPKIIITLRGGDTYIKPWISKSWREFYNKKSHLVDVFVVMSQNQKEYLTKWGISEEKIVVIPISFGNPSDTKPKYPNGDKLKLVSAFRMTWEKNIEGTLQFAKALQEKNIDFEFDIYGDGNDLGELYYLIDCLGLNNCVFPKGKVANEDLLRKLSEYDFMIQLSLSDAFPTTILEAQSRGIPCIVSDSGGLPEAGIKSETIIVNNYNQIDYFADETIKLWKDKERYYSFSKKAIDFVNDNFSTEKEIERLIDLYKKMV